MQDTAAFIKAYNKLVGINYSLSPFTKLLPEQGLALLMETYQLYESGTMDEDKPQNRREFSCDSCRNLMNLSSIEVALIKNYLIGSTEIKRKMSLIDRLETFSKGFKNKQDIKFDYSRSDIKHIQKSKCVFCEGKDCIIFPVRPLACRVREDEVNELCIAIAKLAENTIHRISAVVYDDNGVSSKIYYMPYTLQNITDSLNMNMVQEQ